MSATPRIAYYISAHGYGHGVRSSDVIRALNELRPDVPVTLVTDLPEEFLRNRLPSSQNTVRPGAFDVGMVQLDSIRVDVEATRRRVEELYARREDLVRGETAFLRENGVHVLVADIPAIPLEAAHRAGIPGIAVGNFAWDWIYEEFAAQDPRWRPLVMRFREGYGKADLLLRLPFCEPMAAFRRAEDIPLLASPGRNRREELARLTGCSPGRKWVLLSFTSLDMSDSALAALEQLDGYEFFTVRPLEWRRRNIHAVDRDAVPFSDVLASVDIVVSKPGFGLVSECVANRKPLIYADRTDFREYPILERAVRRYLKSAHIPADALYRGDLREALEAVERQPDAVEKVPAGGALIAARRIAGFLS
ncbi:MAG: hypothetical protein BWK77_06720 [Verrucomicrobia bacterium A1]|nr:MAG: hypothetical protein BWK77_06720 [Verrucomicrobia bacterium A1]